MRKRIGLLLYVSGGLLLSFAAGRYAVGMARADQARQAWDAAEGRAVVALARSAALHHGMRETPVDGAPVARLVIPRLDLDEIVLEGVDADELNAEPGHVTGSAYPGEPGESSARTIARCSARPTRRSRSPRAGRSATSARRLSA